jgi:hypothetical protein
MLPSDSGCPRLGVLVELRPQLEPSSLRYGRWYGSSRGAGAVHSMLMQHSALSTQEIAKIYSCTAVLKGC